MNERPPGTTLGRLLAREAERAVPGDLDLWPSIARRLRSGRPTASWPHHLAGDAAGTRAWNAESPAEGRPVRWARGPIRGHELPGLAATVGLIALVVGLLFGAVGRPGFGGGAVRPGERASPTVPEGCSRELDVELREGAAGAVLISVAAGVARGCVAADRLEIAILDATGTRSAISGNPLSLPVTVRGEERRVDTTVAWANWCGDRARFRLQTSLGDDVGRLPLPILPRCLDATAPSTVRPLAVSTVSGTPQSGSDPAAS